MLKQLKQTVETEKIEDNPFSSMPNAEVGNR